MQVENELGTLIFSKDYDLYYERLIFKGTSVDVVTCCAGTLQFTFDITYACKLVDN
jgi:hypothetical protein